MRNYNKLPFVTIAIPTYNRADSYLKHSLSSAVNQTYSNLEIIVSDNCSTDNTELLVKSFTDGRIRYYRQQENIGMRRNTDFCVSQAKGEYFLLLQDDDLIDDDFIKTCIQSLNQGNQKAGIIRTGVRVINEDGSNLGEIPNMVGGFSTVEFFLAWFHNRPKASMHLCSTLFNAEKLKEIGGFQSKYFLWDDVMSEFKLAVNSGRIDVPDIKASNRRHKNEVSYTVNVSEWCEESLMLMDLMCNLTPEESRSLIRNEGMKFFAKLNCTRAAAVKPLAKRFMAFVTVLNNFGLRYFPFKKYWSYPFKTLLYDTPVYFVLRFLKRRTLQMVLRN